MAIRRMSMVMKKAAIYTRVSTQDQHPEMQQQELVEYVKRRGWTLYKEYSDKGVSGAKERRPALDTLLEDCRRKKLDVVVVWKFDRFARSLKQLLNALELFRTLGIGFVSCTEAQDDGPGCSHKSATTWTRPTAPRISCSYKAN